MWSNAIDELWLITRHQQRDFLLKRKAVFCKSPSDSVLAGTASRPTPAADAQLHLSFGTMLPPGNHSVSIAFNYPLSDGLLGFYKSTYEAGGKNYSLASTMMEPMSARLALPCFDEPALKARSSSSLTYTMSSNTA